MPPTADAVPVTDAAPYVELDPAPIGTTPAATPAVVAEPTLVAVDNADRDVASGPGEHRPSAQADCSLSGQRYSSQQKSFPYIVVHQSSTLSFTISTQFTID